MDEQSQGTAAESAAWAESDAEFTTALGQLRDVQKNDPLKTGTEEDYFVNSMMALLLMETRDPHDKTPNQ